MIVQLAKTSEIQGHYHIYDKSIPGQETHSGVNRFDMFGSTYKTWVGLILEGEAATPGSFHSFAGGVKNAGATDMNLSFVYPFPSVYGPYNLSVVNWKIRLLLADSNDYLNQVRIFENRDGGQSEKYTDHFDDKDAGVFFGGDGNHAAVTEFKVLNEESRVALQMRAVNTTAGEFVLNGVWLEVFYGV